MVIDMSNVIYIVRQGAVYWHNILFASESEESAVTEAKRLASIDIDDHHDFFVTGHDIDTNFGESPEYREEMQANERLIFRTNKSEELLNA